jgi:deoxyribodipyrimidine photolyase
MTQPIVVWLRNDLRLHDHEPIVAALESGAPMIPVYCFESARLCRVVVWLPENRLVSGVVHSRSRSRSAALVAWARR